MTGNGIDSFYVFRVGEVLDIIFRLYDGHGDLLLCRCTKCHTISTTKKTGILFNNYYK